MECSMTFRVGQKVVCVTAHDAFQDWPDYETLSRPPDLGDIATVTNVFMAVCGKLAIELLEYPAPGGTHNGWMFEPGWLAEDFRPLVERKTDISIFTQMLNPSKQGVDA
jgi:hypothetical protein